MSAVSEDLAIAVKHILMIFIVLDFSGVDFGREQKRERMKNRLSKRLLFSLQAGLCPGKSSPSVMMKR